LTSNLSQFSKQNLENFSPKNNIEGREHALGACLDLDLGCELWTQDNKGGKVTLKNVEKNDGPGSLRLKIFFVI